MYRCESCGKFSQPKEGLHKVVVETRPKTYYSKRTLVNGEPKVEGSGTEIVREASMCGTCAAPFAVQESWRA